MAAVSELLITPGAGVVLSNKGTIAILITTIKNLQKIFPSTRIKVELYWPEKQKKIYNIKEEFDNIEIIEHPLGKPISSITALFIAFLLYPIRKISKSIYLNINTGLFPWLEHYAKSDIIISLSAETFIVYYDETITQRIVRYVGGLYTLFLARLFEKRYVLFAQTLAPFGWPFKSIMKDIVKNATLVTLRDDTSYKNLKREDSLYENTYITADPAFLLEINSDKKILDVDKLKIDGKRLIGICLARTTGIKLNEDKYFKYVKVVAEVIDSLIKDYDSIVVFISHSSGKVRETQSDFLVGEDIKNRLENKKFFYILGEDYSPKDIKNIIRKFDLVITHRMHPAIFSLSTGVPCILFGFNEKAYGLMNRFELGDYVVPINNISKEEILIKVDNILNNYEEIKQTINKRIVYVIDLSKKNFELLAILTN